MRTAEGSFSKRDGSCDATATLESTRTHNALRTKDRSSTCVYSICESICENAGVKACENDQKIGENSLRTKGLCYLLRIRLCPTVARQPCPDLGNQNSPQLRLRLTVLRLRILLKIEHALRKRNEVRHKVLEYGGMWLRQQRQEECTWLTTSLPSVTTKSMSKWELNIKLWMN